MADNSRRARTTVVEKVNAILLTFSHGGHHSLTEVAQLTNLPLTTTWRLLTELAQIGLLDRSEDGRYRAGWQLRLIGGHASASIDVRERARQVLEDLAAATRTTVRLGVLHHHAVLCLEKGETRPYWTGTSGVSRVPAHATAMGKALLAFADTDIVAAVIAEGLQQYTPLTLTTPHALRRSLAVTRLTGVALSRGELGLDTCTVAVPAFGLGGTVIAALEIEAGKGAGEVRCLQPVLTLAARTLARELATTDAKLRRAPLTQWTMGAAVYEIRPGAGAETA